MYNTVFSLDLALQHFVTDIKIISQSLRGTYLNPSMS